jgi:hypothetical protein
MIASLFVLALAAAPPGQDTPTPQACVAVYGALGEVQLSVNTDDSVLERRYATYGAIDFAGRAQALADKVGDPGLIGRSEGLESALYVRLIGAQNAGEPNSADVKDIGALEQACDGTFDFEPTLAR